MATEGVSRRRSTNGKSQHPPARDRTQLSAALNNDGTVVSLLGGSLGEMAARVSPICLGKKGWSNTPRSQRVVKEALAGCLLGECGAVSEVVSHVGMANCWRIRFIKCVRQADVLLVAEKIPHHPVKLTNRQTRMLELLICGEDVRTIARKLECRMDSIHHSLRRLRKKFKARTTAQLAVLAAEAGIR